MMASSVSPSTTWVTNPILFGRQALTLRGLRGWGSGNYVGLGRGMCGAKGEGSGGGADPWELVGRLIGKPLVSSSRLLFSAQDRAENSKT